MTDGLRVRSTPTAALDFRLLAHMRAMLDTAFDGDFSDEDWGHALGGRHFWIENETAVLCHAAVVPRPLRRGPITRRL